MQTPDVTTTPFFGPLVSLGKMMSGVDITAEEFLTDFSPWVICYLPDAAYDLLGEVRENPDNG